MGFTQYFEIISIENRVIHVEIRGFWSDSSIDDMAADAMAQFVKAVDELSRHGSFLILADMRELAVLTTKARDYLARAMTYSKEHGLYKSVDIISNPTAALGVDEAARQADYVDCRVVVNSLEEGEKVLEQLKREMSATQASS
jgi:hypothetical protein